ncbi:secreted protein C [Hetaerina americana]|uniref:secreted protein C n=1 Tax=Hetaerina americana TaxID=62018 RepID=UPI003A7F212C
MEFRAIVLCIAALMVVSCNAGRIVRNSGSYSSSSSSSSSSSGSIYFGNPGNAYSGSTSGGYASGSPGNFGTGPHTAYSGYDQNQPDLLTRSGFVDTGNTGTKGVFSASSSSIDSDGKIHYSVQAGRL